MTVGPERSEVDQPAAEQSQHEIGIEAAAAIAAAVLPQLLGDLQDRRRDG